MKRFINWLLRRKKKTVTLNIHSSSHTVRDNLGKMVK